jgi:hypothetical protein
MAPEQTGRVLCDSLRIAGSVCSSLLCVGRRKLQL